MWNDKLWVYHWFLWDWHSFDWWPQRTRGDPTSFPPPNYPWTSSQWSPHPLGSCNQFFIKSWTYVNTERLQPRSIYVHPYIHNHWSSKVRIASFFLQRNLQLCHKSLVLWTEQQCTELVQLFTCITFKELIFVNSVGYSNQIVLVGSFVKIWQAFFLFPFKDLTYICSVNVRIRSRVSWGQFCVPIVPVQLSCWY